MAPGYAPTPRQKSAAIKNAKYVSSSLAFHDVEGAVDYLLKALHELTGQDFERV